PELDRVFLRERLSRERDFVWLKRGMTPRDRARIHNLGLPGVGFVEETRRVYPAGRTLAHVVGHVNVANQGKAANKGQRHQLQPPPARSITVHGACLVRGTIGR
ncbi:MAG: hypothetical protein HKN60_09225, partial [Rhizobiales bacterium]|nr:hypothetical protein [Hyphomicrobiales bacterium]